MVTKTNAKITHWSAHVFSSSLTVKWQKFWWCEIARTIHRLSTCYTIDEIIVMKYAVKYRKNC